MISVKRNSTEFKEIKNIFDDYENNAARKRLIRLYALKPTGSLEEMVLINTLKQNAGVIYDLQYATIMEYLRDRKEKLYREDKKALYYFKHSPGSDWLKAPFELTGHLKKEVFPLSVVR